MSVYSRSSGWSSSVSLPFRALTQRYSYLLFVGLSLLLLIMGRAQPALMENARIHVMDGLAPVMDALTRPMAASENVVADIRHYFSLKSENERLLAENAQMRQWQDAVVALQNENRELRTLTHFKAEPGLAYISARVIADAGGAYERGLVVTAGRIDGVREGMAAMVGEGLIGRVVEVGNWSSRVVLITDLNSKIPVTIADTGDRAVVAGDNTAEPKLHYLPQDALLKDGTRVVTSGHGGVFPANLVVGVVHDLGHGDYSVIPAAELGRVNYVRLIDFDLRGGSFNPIANKLRTVAAAR